jgi:hypothetical protein
MGNSNIVARVAYRRTLVRRIDGLSKTFAQTALRMYGVHGPEQ